MVGDVCLLWLLFLLFDFSHNSRAAASSSIGHYEDPISASENHYVMELSENKVSEEANKNVSGSVASPQESEYEVGDASWEPTMLCRYQSWGAPSPRKNTYLFSFLPLTNRLDKQWLLTLHSPCSENAGTSVTDCCIEFLILFSLIPFHHLYPLKPFECCSRQVPG